MGDLWRRKATTLSEREVDTGDAGVSKQNKKEERMMKKVEEERRARCALFFLLLFSVFLAHVSLAAACFFCAGRQRVCLLQWSPWPAAPGVPRWGVSPSVFFSGCSGLISARLFLSSPLHLNK